MYSRIVKWNKFNLISFNQSSKLSITNHFTNGNLYFLNSFLFSTKKKIKSNKPFIPLHERPRSKEITNQLFNFRKEVKISDRFVQIKFDENEIANFDTFPKIGITHPTLLDNLTKLQISSPSNIQRRVIPEIMSSKSSDILFASETGSGKTLAYLLPLLTYLLSDSVQRKRGQRMKSLILVPTRELSKQIQQVTSTLSYGTSITFFEMSGGKTTPGQEFFQLNTGLDILISTPEKFLNHCLKEHIYLDNLSHVVIDEGDTLLDVPFDESLKILFTQLKKRKQNSSLQLQIIVCTATVTKSIIDNLTAYSSASFRIIIRPLIHMKLENVREYFYRVQQLKKLASLRALLKKRTNKGKRTIIFCNSTQSCKEVFMYLKRKGYSLRALHHSLSIDERANNFKKFAEKQVKILVSTDISSRGIDFVDVDHVILYDFPNNAIDYLHRVGRTGRFGKRGKVSSFVTPSSKVIASFIQRLGVRNEGYEATPVVVKNQGMVQTKEESRKRETQEENKDLENPEDMEDMEDMEEFEDMEDMEEFEDMEDMEEFEEELEEEKEMKKIRKEEKGRSKGPATNNKRK